MRLDGEIGAAGRGRMENDTECMSVYDFFNGEKLLSVTLDGNPDSFTYRCVYYE